MCIITTFVVLLYAIYMPYDKRVIKFRMQIYVAVVTVN